MTFAVWEQAFWNALAALAPPSSGDDISEPEGSRHLGDFYFEVAESGDSESVKVSLQATGENSGGSGFGVPFTFSLETNPSSAAHEVAGAIWG